MSKPGYTSRFSVFFRHWLTVLAPVLLYFIFHRLSSLMLDLRPWQIAIDVSVPLLTVAFVAAAASSPLALISAPKAHRAAARISAGSASVFFILFTLGVIRSWPAPVTAELYTRSAGLTFLILSCAMAVVCGILLLKTCRGARDFIAEGAGRLSKIFLALVCGSAVILTIGLFSYYFAPTPQPAPELSRTSAGRAKNVLLITFDALSARDMSLYGYRLDTTPRINSFAGSCAVFENFYAQSNWTLPTTSSIITGIYPSEHRNINYLYYWHRLSKPQNTLAQVLKQQGFHTAILSSNLSFGDPLANGTSSGVDLVDKSHTVDWSEFFRIDPFGAAKLYTCNSFTNGFPVLFDILRSFFYPGFAIYWPGDIRPIFAYAKTLLTREPFFVWIHLAPPHEPYLPPPPHRDMFCKSGRFTSVIEQTLYTVNYPPELQKDIDELRLRYDESIHYCDSELGVFLDSLQGTKILDDTLLIISADHGQSFEDGYCGHNWWPLWNQLIKIPLVVRLPGIPASRLQANAEQIDLAPTILDALGIQQPPWMPGETLLPYMLGKKAQTDKPKYAMQLTGNSRFAKNLTSGIFAVMLGPLKLLYTIPDESTFLYDLASDPGEDRDIAESRPGDVKKLQSLIKRDILGNEGS